MSVARQPDNRYATTRTTMLSAQYGRSFLMSACYPHFIADPRPFAILASCLWGVSPIRLIHKPKASTPEPPPSGGVSVCQSSSGFPFIVVKNRVSRYLFVTHAGTTLQKWSVPLSPILRRLTFIFRPSMMAMMPQYRTGLDFRTRFLWLFTSNSRSLLSISLYAVQ